MRAAGAALIAALVCTPAIAAPEEIQVYMDEMNGPGRYGLDTHLSYVTRGSFAPERAGAELAVHRLRITPEFSYGITPSLEAGMYLPLVTLDHNGDAQIEGVKFRLKYIAPHAGHPNLWYGINFEIGRVDYRLDVNPWNAELKAILGTRKGPWTIAGNVNFDFVVSGPDKQPISVDADLKLSYALSRTFALGLETYDGVGDFHRLGTFLANEQAIYATADTTFGDWDLNIGIGRGYGSNQDKWIIKMIIGVPLERLLGRIGR